MVNIVIIYILKRNKIKNIGKKHKSVLFAIISNRCEMYHSVWAILGDPVDAHWKVLQPSLPGQAWYCWLFPHVDEKFVWMLYIKSADSDDNSSVTPSINMITNHKADV